MKKILLILSLFIFSLNINAQSGFVQNRKYQQKYTISSVKLNNGGYDIDKYGRTQYYEWWRIAKWYSHQGNSTYYTWQYNQQYNCYQWYSYTEWGNYWYYRWQNYKRYYYFYNGRKYYNN